MNMNESASKVMKRLLTSREPNDMKDVNVQTLVYNPLWVDKEIKLLYTETNRIYREKQLYNFKIETIKRYLRLLLESHLEIDEVQEWIIKRIIWFEELSGGYLSTDAMKMMYGVSHLIKYDGSELYQFRKNLLELLR